MGVPSQGEYGIPEKIVSGFPVKCDGETYSIIQNLNINDALQKKSIFQLGNFKMNRKILKVFCSNLCQARKLV